ncbi:MAG TPA: hypothetical protein VFP84_27925 [Kofleriaceae bacterium]|nr:hypothetical protein [Kofleriaceae bacterium]
MLTPKAPPLREAWQIILRALEHARISAEDLHDVLVALRQERDLIVEEVGFEHIAGRLRVSWLDEHVDCAAAALIAALDELISAA